MAEKEQFDIICFGECVIDHISQVSPPVDKGFPTGIAEYKVLFGGRGLNFTVTAGIFTRKILLISAVGADYIKSGLKKHLKRHEIDDSRFYHSREFDLPKTFIYNHGNKSRLYFYPGLWAKAKKAIKGHLTYCAKSLRSKILYCTSGDSSLNAYLLKNFIAEFKVFAPAHDLHLYRSKDLFDILPHVNALFLNQPEAVALQAKLNMKTGKILSRYGLNLIVTTLGARGSRLITKEQELDIPACPADTVRDRTGAGDGFAAAFLCSYLTTGQLRYSAQIANATSSFLIESDGAHSRLPTCQAILQRHRTRQSNSSPAKVK